MRPLTRNYLLTKFREYYLAASREAPTRFDSARLDSREWSLMLPPHLESREWGFMFFDESGMRRHMSFLSQGELVDYLLGMVPAHVYYSAAYYQRPGAPTMKEKLWQGADLIFDLDADHLKKAPKSYGQMLDLVKKETLKLLGFLTGDFGFAEQSMSVVFSGGRGYHIHVRDPGVFGLGSDERREIVDYLTGRGLDIKRFIKEIPKAGDKDIDRIAYHLAKKHDMDPGIFQKKLMNQYSYLVCPPENSAGWGGRINSSILSFVQHLSNLEKKEAFELLLRKGRIGEDRAKRFYNYLKAPNVVDLIRKGNLDVIKGSPEIWEMLIGEYLDGKRVDLGLHIDKERGETDEPVTTDVRRLIRCPTSLHGGSGLRVTPLSLQALEEFDHLWDAVVFGEEPVAVEVIKPFSTEMIGQSYKLQEGRTELPACVAVFLMARGAAELGRAADR